MADVFISYKSERVGAVQHLANIIEAHGFSVWFDVRGLAPGPSLGPQIEAALREAKVVLVLWCGLSKSSDWVIEEADLAKGTRHLRSGAYGSKRSAPARISNGTSLTTAKLVG